MLLCKIDNLWGFESRSLTQSPSSLAHDWSSEGKLIVGLLDGRIRQAFTNSNKCSTLCTYKFINGASVWAFDQQFVFI